MFKKKVLFGCEGRGDADSPYLTRYYLLQTKWGNLCLHIFHRSDHDVMHSHPWNFFTLVLWRGYIEEYEYQETLAHRPGTSIYTRFPAPYLPSDIIDGKPTFQWQEVVKTFRASRRVYPGMFLFRPATFVHRVVLHKDKHGKEKPSATLVWMGNRQREWGFREPDGAEKPWQQYFKENGC